MQIKANDYKPKEIVKIIREWTELTQNQFGKTINKSGATVADYEYGRTNVNLPLLLDICKRHGIEIIIRKK